MNIEHIRFLTSSVLISFNTRDIIYLIKLVKLMKQMWVVTPALKYGSPPRSFVKKEFRKLANVLSTINDYKYLYLSYFLY